MEISLSMTPDQWQKVYDAFVCSHWAGYEYGDNEADSSPDLEMANEIKRRLATFNVQIKDN